MNMELPIPNTHTALLEFFRGLADVRRLQIAGRLAAGSCSVEQLAEQLGQSPQEIRQQMFSLEHAGLVSGPDGSAQTYRLRLDYVHALANQILAHERTTVPPEAVAGDFERKVLREFLPFMPLIRLPYTGALKS
ncbi:MAG: helix-turn-helix transcriptional regulator [Anaerolineales bacterium]|nr:helix-turn-helix transcriptional regulator [Anaerolineales bacterium]